MLRMMLLFSNATRGMWTISGVVEFLPGVPFAEYKARLSRFVGD